MYDVIIVGAGVAGSYLASILEGLNVLLIEKNKKVVLRDSGVVSSSFFSFFPEEFVKAEIRRMDFYSPSGKLLSLCSPRPFSYIIRRESFSHYLLKKASGNADVRHETVIDIVREDGFVKVVTDSGEYSARVLVGADGARSIVRRKLGEEDPEIYTGIFEICSFSPFENVSVFVNKYFSPEFFAWAIPQSNEHGIIASKRPDEYLSFFKKRAGMPSGKAYSYSLPMGVVKSYGDNFILLGEAAGQVKPLTGGGIVFSLKSVWHAKMVIEQAFRSSSFSSSWLSQYDNAWKMELGAEIRKQLYFRQFFRKLANKDIDRIFDLMKPAVSRIDEFDYDYLSSLARQLPKLSLARFIFPRLISRSLV